MIDTLFHNVLNSDHRDMIQRVIISESDPQYLKSATVHALRREGDTVRYLVTLIHDDDAPNVRVSVELFSIAIRDTDDHFPTSSLAVFRTEI